MTRTVSQGFWSQEELPGLGHKFELIGAMVRDTDPENAIANPGGSGGGVARMRRAAY